MSARRAVALCAAATLSLGSTFAAAESAGQCHVVDVHFKPVLRPDLTPGVNPWPQIVVWLEDTNGTYIDTIFITQETGSHGLGNRPGRFDFNSGPLWPYGRRTTTFPIWSNRHGHEFDTVVFQNLDENNLSHPFNQSSRDTHYCRPMQPTEPYWDALSCASPNSVYTDKGMLQSTTKSKYPPRSDITRAPGMDHATVENFKPNPFDAVSQPTPKPTGDATAQVSWPIPQDLPAGSYVMWVEVAKEFDHNATYSEAARPSPMGIPWAEYGDAYRGQPSVVFEVPFSIGTTQSTAQVTDYAGYGDPDGLDGNLRTPDATITTSIQGSGAGRFALVTDADGSYRVRVVSRPEFDADIPGAPAQGTVEAMTSSTATLTFVAPGDDGNVGRVTSYDIRYMVGDVITDANFDAAIKYTSETIPLTDPGVLQSFTLDRLLPETQYSVGIKAFDDCHNASPLTVITFTTPERAVGEVDACFIATAAYGSVMAADVQMLRHLRDSVLRKTILGELAVETYYTFGPAFAGVIGESELLRATAREILAPIVRYVRAFRF